MADKSGSWIFTDAAERDAAIGSEGLITGDTCLLLSDFSEHYFDGAAWQTLGGGGGLSALTETGLPLDDLVFSIDGRNLSSLDLDAGEWNDTVASITGTITGTTMANGHVNFAEGTDRIDYGVLPTALVDLFAGGGTVAFWCRVESDGGGNFGRIIDTQDSSSEGWSIYVRDELTDDRFQFALLVGDGAASPSFETNTRFALNRWHHVVFVWDSDTPATPPTVYVNGVAEAVSLVGGAPVGYVSDAGNTLLVGNRSNLDRGFDGDIEIVTLYDTAKDARYAREVYRSQATRFGWLVGSTSLNATGGVGVETVGILGANAGTAAEEGGDVLVQAGTNTGGIGSARGGNLTLRAGDALANNGAGGSLTIQAGDAAGPNNADGGDISILAGNAVNNQGQGGSVLIQGGATLGAITMGGPVTLKGGLGSTITGDGGIVTVEGGDGNEGGGDVFLRGGQTLAGFNGPCGSVFIEGGDPALTTNGFTAGSVSIRAGTRQSTTATQVGGSVSITAGDTGTSNAEGGSVTITAGSTLGFNGRAGGDIILTAGDEEGNGNGFSRGGDVVLTSGTTVNGVAPNGRQGRVILDGLRYPRTDGSANQAIVTDGAGDLSFASVSALTRTKWVGSVPLPDAGVEQFLSIQGDGANILAQGQQTYFLAPANLVSVKVELRCTITPLTANPGDTSVSIYVNRSGTASQTVGPVTINADQAYEWDLNSPGVSAGDLFSIGVTPTTGTPDGYQVVVTFEYDWSTV